MQEELEALLGRKVDLNTPAFLSSYFRDRVEGVGANLGVGLFQGGVETRGFAKILVCWVGTPVGALVASVLLCQLLRQ